MSWLTGVMGTMLMGGDALVMGGLLMTDNVLMMGDALVVGNPLMMGEGETTGEMIGEMVSVDNISATLVVVERIDDVNQNCFTNKVDTYYWYYWLNVLKR